MSAYSPLATDSIEQLKSEALASLRALGPQLRVPVKSSIVLLAAVLFCIGDNAKADGVIPLTKEQQKILLEEANECYAMATAEQVSQLGEVDQVGETSKTAQDLADNKALLEQAAAKYQLVADSGLRSPMLFFNLGNCWLQLAQYGQAIACFEQAHRFAPHDRSIATNLRFARSKLKLRESPSLWTQISEFNDAQQNVAWSVVMATWIGFWSVLGLRLFRWRLPLAELLAGCLLCLFVISFASLLLSVQHRASFDGVVVAEPTELHQSDGNAFAVVGKLNAGQRVKFGESRGAWLQVRQSGTTPSGWVKNEAVRQIRD